VSTIERKSPSSDERSSSENKLLKGSPEADLTGRDRMTYNVVASWVGYLVFVVAGLILPRMIDRHIGQTALGIWDFAWSLVSYFSIAGLGIGSSVNRYVAKCRSAQDLEGLRAAVSSVCVIQVVSGIMVGVISLAAGWSIPYFFSERLGPNSTATQLVVVLLGLSIAVQMAFDSFRGVITGCHRWDVHNGLNSGSYAIISIGMIVALMLGGHLVSMSVVYLGGTVLGEVARVWAAYRICPEISIRLRYFNFLQAREMFGFGLKGIAAGIPGLIIGQGTSIFVTHYIGPAMLAVFARSAALVKHSDVIINKFSSVLTPTAGSLQGSGKFDDVQKLLFSSARIGVYLTLPIVLFLSILGDPLLRLWMGDRYESGLVLVILAVGSFLPISLQSVFSILTGLNLHGWVGAVSSLVTVISFGLGALALTFIGWDLHGAAVIIAISSTLGLGILRPLYGCLKLKVPILKFLWETFSLPTACGAPFALCLAAIQMLLVERPLIAVLAGCAGGVLILGPLYWRYLLPETNRQKFKSPMRKLAGAEGCGKLPVRQSSRDAEAQEHRD
jgi:O-antigen/teichoic acid export membrane protein